MVLVWMAQWPKFNQIESRWVRFKHCSGSVWAQMKLTKASLVLSAAVRWSVLEGSAAVSLQDDLMAVSVEQRKHLGNEPFGCRVIHWHYPCHCRLPASVFIAVAALACLIRHTGLVRWLNSCRGGGLKDVK